MRARAGTAKRAGRLCLTALLVSAALEAPASADELHYPAPLDLELTLGGAGTWVLSEGFKADLAPSGCRWCDRSAAGQDVLNPVDRSLRRLRWRRRAVADVLSSLTAFVATPMAAGGFTALAASHDNHPAEIGADLVLVAQAGVLAADLNQLVKFLAARERPDAHARALAEPGARRLDVDDDLSFYSGHTTEAVSLAVAGGTVASVRGYRLAPLVWGVGLPLALATGYLRIGADRHYFTDVLAGAIAGAVVGFLVPYFHRADSTTGAPGPSGQNSVLAFSGVW